MVEQTHHSWLRFSLRKLLALVGAFSIILGLASTLIHWQLRNSREHAAIIAVSGLGGTYTMESAWHVKETGRVRGRLYLRSVNRVAKIDLSQDAWPVVERRNKGKASPPAGDDDIPVLRSFAGLRVLDLSGLGVTDRGIKHLKHLQSLEELEIDGTHITDAGFEELREALPGCRIRR